MHGPAVMSQHEKEDLFERFLAWRRGAIAERRLKLRTVASNNNFKTGYFSTSSVWILVRKTKGKNLYASNGQKNSEPVRRNHFAPSLASKPGEVGEVEWGVTGSGKELASTISLPLSAVKS